VLEPVAAVVLGRYTSRTAAHPRRDNHVVPTQETSMFTIPWARKTLLLTALLFVVGSLFSSKAQACEFGGKVAYTVLPIPNTNPVRKMAVWYPTNATETTFTYPTGMVSHVAPGAAGAACEPMPLILFSHGYLGCSLQSIYVTEALARMGFIVAAPDHVDSTCAADGVTSPQHQDPTGLFPNTDQDQLSRAIDVQLTKALLLDLNTSYGGTWINTSKIAAMGHSLGGHTVFGLAGGWSTWKDTAYKAVIGLSPWIPTYQNNGQWAQLTPRHTLSQINIPVMYQGAQWDSFITPLIKDPNPLVGFYAGSNSPKFMLEAYYGSHFEWTDAICTTGSTVDNCIATHTNAQVINSYIFHFFNAVLNGNLNSYNYIMWPFGWGTASYARQ